MPKSLYGTNLLMFNFDFLRVPNNCRIPIQEVLVGVVASAAQEETEGVERWKGGEEGWGEET